MIKLKLILIFVFIQICFAQNVFENILNQFDIKRVDDIFSSIWIQSISATLLVSAAPVLVIFAIPDLKNHHNLLKVLLAFAAGGLLGDAFLHLIPHSIDPHDHASLSHGHDDHFHNEHHHGHSHEGGHNGHSHDSHHGHSHESDHHGHSHHDSIHGQSHHDHTKNIIVGLWVVAGIMTFLCVEKFVRLVKGDQGHSHSIHSKSSTSDGDSVIVSRGESANPDTEVRHRKSKENKSTASVAKKKEVPNKDIKVSGYLNLVADFAHNFTDGLAIGASFLVNKNVGIVTTITILFHELPHEIGDYAILIQSGCSRKKAILLQLVTAIGAIFGTVISLISQDAGTSSTWILPFTAGGFIYISTVSVIPELLEEHTKLSQTVYEILAMVVGVAMMIAIAYFE